MSTAQPIQAAEFAAAMQRLSPFEKNPTIAVGVSGGGDSMALLHLAHEWAMGQGGRAIAFTVDHNIRAESAAEAAQVGVWATQLGIEHVILKWDAPDAASSALQQRARAARYDLLEEAAASRGIVHLLVAHHEDDQAETVLLRLSKGSGPDGLAGMSAIVHKPKLRVLRPLLGFPKERLVATCHARFQPWIDDPSNLSARFGRPRLRAVGDALADEGLTAHHLALTAAACGRTRAAMERATARLLAAHARIMPQGYAEFVFGSEDPEIERRALAELVQMIGGGNYPANAAAMEQVLSKLSSFAGNDGSVVKITLGGCLIERIENKLTIIREDRNIEPALSVGPGLPLYWERFQIRSAEFCEVGALGDHLPENAVTDLPKAILATQPAFRVDGVVKAIPTIGYYADPALAHGCKAWFSPKLAAGKADFAIV